MSQNFCSEEFVGKNAIITGGSNGIGLHCARDMLRRGLNKLAIIDLIVAQDSCRRLVNEFGKEHIMLVKCDVSLPNDLENAFKIIVDEFKHLDIVVNNAGILNDAAWEKEVVINLNGTIRGTLLGMKFMSRLEGGSGGTIVNMSALAGLQPSAGCPIYSAISHAIVGLTNAFAMPFHYKRTGVRMITLCPGITYTKIIAGVCKKMLNEDMGKEWLKELSTTSTQKPENVAASLVKVLLLADNGSAWVSDAGQTAYEVKIPRLTEMRTN